MNIPQTLRVESRGLNDVLPEDLKAKLLVPYRQVVGRGFRTVFLTFSFVSGRTAEEVGPAACEKFLVPELLKLDRAFKILGSLTSGCALMRLVGPAASRWLLEHSEEEFGGFVERWRAFEEFCREHEDTPPFRYDVFCFVTVEYPDPVHLETEKEFLARVRAAGVDCSPEGAVGPDREWEGA